MAVPTKGEKQRQPQVTGNRYQPVEAEFFQQDARNAWYIGTVHNSIISLGAAAVSKNIQIRGTKHVGFLSGGYFKDVALKESCLALVVQNGQCGFFTAGEVIDLPSSPSLKGTWYQLQLWWTSPCLMLKPSWTKWKTQCVYFFLWLSHVKPRFPKIWLWRTKSPVTAVLAHGPVAHRLTGAAS